MFSVPLLTSDSGLWLLPHILGGVQPPVPGSICRSPVESDYLRILPVYCQVYVRSSPLEAFSPGQYPKRSPFGPPLRAPLREHHCCAWVGHLIPISPRSYGRTS
jgi:hypothetical protein